MAVEDKIIDMHQLCVWCRGGSLVYFYLHAIKHIVALLSIVYMLYQYRRFFFKAYYDGLDEDEYGCCRPRLSRSRSRSYSRSRSRPRSTSSYRNYKLDDAKNTRRGRKSQRRCYND